MIVDEGDHGLNRRSRTFRHRKIGACDGATYHSAKSARDRDRLRQEVLEGLGWKLHRIWSTDWFNNPGQEAEKLRTAITSQLAALKVREKEFSTRSCHSSMQVPADRTLMSGQTIGPSDHRAPFEGGAEPEQ